MEKYKWYQRLYIDMMVAYDHIDQIPEVELMKWYDTLWLLFPIVGQVIFYEVVKDRCRK